MERFKYIDFKKFWERVKLVLARFNYKLFLFDLFKTLTPMISAYFMPKSAAAAIVITNALYGFGMIMGIDSGIKTYRYLKIMEDK